MAAYKPVSSSFKATEFQLSKVTNFRIWWNGSEMGCEYKSFYQNKVKFMSFGIDWRAHANDFTILGRKKKKDEAKKNTHTHMMKPSQWLKMEMIFSKALSAKQINEGNSNRSKTFGKLK